MNDSHAERGAHCVAATYGRRAGQDINVAATRRRDADSAGAAIQSRAISLCAGGIADIPDGDGPSKGIGRGCRQPDRHACDIGCIIGGQADTRACQTAIVGQHQRIMRDEIGRCGTTDTIAPKADGRATR